MGNTTNTFLILFAGVSLLFYFAGLLVDVDGNPVSNPFIEILLAPQDMDTLPFYVTLTTAIGGIAAVIAIGIVTKNLELAVMTTVTLAMVPILWNFIVVFTVLHSINEVISLLIFAPLMFLFMMNMVDYWRGRD